jgi:hypothetical protein
LTFPRGTRVLIYTRDRFDGRQGTVIQVYMGEVGVKFGTGQALVWFRPEELIRLQ